MMLLLPLAFDKGCFRFRIPYINRSGIKSIFLHFGWVLRLMHEIRSRKIENSNYIRSHLTHGNVEMETRGICWNTPKTILRLDFRCPQ